MFALLDEFDPLDTAALPFVEVDTGLWEGAPHQVIRRRGFLLQATNSSFRVRYLDLGIQVLQPSGPGTPAYGRTGFRPVDLRRYADELAVRLGDRRLDRDSWQDDRFAPGPIGPDTLALLLARACSRRGMQAQVDALWATLPRHWRTRQGLIAPYGAYRFQCDLADQLVVDFSNPAFGWRDLLSRHEHRLATFSPAHAAALRRHVDRRRVRRARSRHRRRQCRPARLARAHPARWVALQRIPQFVDYKCDDGSRHEVRASSLTLEHLRLPCDAPEVAAARSPPQQELPW